MQLQNSSGYVCFVVVFPSPNRYMINLGEFKLGKYSIQGEEFLGADLNFIKKAPVVRMSLVAHVEEKKVGYKQRGTNCRKEYAFSLFLFYPQLLKELVANKGALLEEALVCPEQPHSPCMWRCREAEGGPHNLRGRVHQSPSWEESFLWLWWLLITPHRTALGHFQRPVSIFISFYLVMELDVQ